MVKKAQKTSVEAPKWTKSSWGQILELKPRVRDKWNLQAITSRADLANLLVDTLESDNSTFDNEARMLVDGWCQLAYQELDLMFPSSKGRKTHGLREKRRTFFNVHYELLKPDVSQASKCLNKARQEHGLEHLKPIHLIYKQCLIIPESVKRVSRDHKSNSSAGAKPDNTIVAPSSSSKVDEGQPTPDSGKALDHTHVTEVAAEIRSIECVQDTTQHVPSLGMDSLEPNTSLLSIPSLIYEDSIHSGPSEGITPSTMLSELPNVFSQPPKQTRRGTRGIDSRKQWNDKKILENEQDGTPASTADTVVEVNATPVAEHSNESKKKKSKKLKPPRKNKKRNQALSVSGQQVRIAKKNSEMESSESIPQMLHEAAPMREGLSSLSPDGGNMLQLDIEITKTVGEPESSPGLKTARLGSHLMGVNVTSFQTPPKSCDSAFEYPKSSSSEALDRVNLRMVSPYPTIPIPVAPTTGKVSNIYTPHNYSPAPLSQAIYHQPPASVSVEEPNGSNPKAQGQSENVLFPGSATKSSPRGGIRIPVWAVSRQELCELPYFKSMQGGVYSRAHTVYGYLLGRFPSPRDAWRHDGRIIVSHGGGKNMINEDQMQPDDSTPIAQSKHHLGDDQLETDASIRGLLRAYRMFRPIVLIAEADYEHLQKFNLKRGYAKDANYYVLGHYAIVAAWGKSILPYF
ncbi:melanoma inhibitory activity protein 3 [Ceratobasidium sp. AG-Ba]|nr:melanoma inhibitory activity protein 3 [Ceratobasidium sp. AG-Ba]